MSKIINQLTPEDFGKTFDAATFAEWKKAMDAVTKPSFIIINMALLWAGIGAIYLLGMIGIGLFFVLSFIAIGIAVPKQNKRKKYQRQLGITNSDVTMAVKKCRDRTSQIEN